MVIEYGESYYLSTEGYFFSYLPIERPRVEVRLFKRGLGSNGIDRVVIHKDDLTSKKHHELINRFEANISLGRY